MINEHWVIKQIIEEIVHRYNVNDDEGIAEQYFYEALMDEDVRDKIYDKIYCLTKDR